MITNQEADAPCIPARYPHAARWPEESPRATTGAREQECLSCNQRPPQSREAFDAFGRFRDERELCRVQTVGARTLSNSLRLASASWGRSWREPRALSAVGEKEQNL